MILFKCACGTPGMAPDGSSGQQYTCSACGATRTVPAESDPDCVLIYRSGLPDEGQVVTAEQFQGMVDAGELKANDLIWHQDIWMPLGEVFEMPEIESTAPVSGVDLAMHLTDLPPMPLDGLQPSSRSMAKNTAKMGRRSRSRRKSKLGLFERPEARKRGVLIRVSSYALVFVFVLLGYNFGLGKLLNYVLHRPAYVLVCNGANEDYDLVLLGQSKRVGANASVVFQDLYVPGTRHKTLKVSKVGSADVLLQERVPVKPGMDVVVNLAAKQEFAVYDLAAVSEQGLSASDIGTLVQELREAKDPSSVFALSSKVRGLAAPLLLERKKDKIITSHQYDLSMMPITRSSDYLARRSDQAQVVPVGAEKAQENQAAATPKRVLLPTVRQELKFHNATVAYDPDEARNAFSLRLAFEKGFCPLNVNAQALTRGKTTVKNISGKTWAKVSFEDQALVMSFSLPGSVMEGRKPFRGTWSYCASMALAGKDKDNWHWHWRFTGTAKPDKGRKTGQKIDLSVDQAGKVSKKIQ